MINETKDCKPVDADVNFKYICPTENCGAEYWLSLKETQVQNFKVFCKVCDCVFIPKPIKSVTVNFIAEQPTKPQEVKEKNNDCEPTENTDTKIGAEGLRRALLSKMRPTENNYDFIDTAVSSLVALGFNKAESRYMIEQQWKKTGKTDCAELIKLAFNDLIGVNE